MKFKQLIEQREVKESYDDYHGDMSKEEYDKTVKGSEMEYSVWVGGTEVNDNYLSYDEAVRLYDKYKAQGYDDVQLDARIKESVNEVEKRWKQTSMSPEEAIAKYGKENVKVKKGALRNGDDMVEVFVESAQTMTEAQFDEAAGEKDACYHKVKARYKVWPSAYASGALVQCRKKGAKNWGNSKS